MFTTPVNSVPCYSTVSFLQRREQLVEWPASNAVLREWREQTWSEILEVLTPAQGYLMFFNNRGLTASPLVSLSNPIHFFSINSFLLKYPVLPSSYCHSSKDTWLRSQLSKRFWATVRQEDRQAGSLRKLLHLSNEFLSRRQSQIFPVYITVHLSFKHLLSLIGLSEHKENCKWLSAVFPRTIRLSTNCWNATMLRMKEFGGQLKEANRVQEFGGQLVFLCLTQWNHGVYLTINAMQSGF